ncbi:uncharacterized protein TEOVI_000339300 [Trypanosoma equiperdum]|uniref:Uncharacterized protein n=1 Tax=Trypanosoma equiperdum TaxID=5694 RepID=A0A1G4IHA4_TRYEQ|nr:hypothetical protein, conserved [Trypanosoma equiperdum]
MTSLLPAAESHDVRSVETTDVSSSYTNPAGAPHVSPSSSSTAEKKSVGTMLFSKTLFSLPPVSSVHRCQEDGSNRTLMAFPVDDKHLLVVVGPSSAASDTTTSLYVVRQTVGGSQTCGRVCLPIATVSGCVRDESGHSISQHEKRGSFLMSEQSTDNVDGGRSPDRSSRLISPLDESVDTGSVDNDNSTPQNRVVGGTNASDQEFTNRHNPSHVYLVADAAGHAIWAVEVNTESLGARIVPACCYWGQCMHDGKVDGVKASTRGQHQKGCVASAVPLLGGSKGFADGPFQVARFNSPSSLCWGADMEGGKGRKPRECAVLFVSDEGNHAIRQVDLEKALVRTIAGIGGVSGYRDGGYTASQLQRAAVLLWSSAGLLFVDKPNRAVRLIAQTARAEDGDSGNIMKKPPPLTSVTAPAHPHVETEGDKKERSKQGEEVCEDEVQVSTVAGGISSGVATPFDDDDIRCSSLGTSTAAAVMPDGSGILFADGGSGALQLLSSQGIKMIVSPHGHGNSSGIPPGLVGCTHLVACKLILHSSASPHIAFLASSGSNQTVSMLVLRGGADDGGMTSFNYDGHTNMLLQFAATSELQRGVLRRYKKVENRAGSDYQSTKVSATGTTTASNDCHVKRLFDEALGDLDGNVTPATQTVRTSRTSCAKALPWKTSSGDQQLTDRTGRAAGRVLDIYMRYARRLTRQHMGFVTCSPRCKHYLRNLWGTRSLSLIGFWRMVTHAGYFATCSAPTAPLMFPSWDGRSPTRDARRQKGNSVLHLNLCDWRIALELLYEWSIRRHGHHVVSLMEPAYFSRVLVLLYRWRGSMQQQPTTQQGEEGVLLSPEWFADGLFDENDSEVVVAAHEDFLSRIKNAKELLRGAAKARGGDGRQQEGDEVKILGDETLQLLLLNEGPLRQLFNAYGKTTFITTRSTVSHDSTKKPILAMLRLRQSLNIGQEYDKVPLDHVVGMPYKEFRRLFFTMGVFPTLITESLLRRAFVDSLMTPLFRSIQMEIPSETTSNKCKKTKGGSGSNEIKPKGGIHQYVDRSPCNVQRYVSDNVELSFLIFVEAFTRVALTIFSLCPEHDRRAYPTAAAKVEALMRWINRSVELHHTRECDTLFHVGSQKGVAPPVSYTLRQLNRPFPAFILNGITSTTK